MLALCPHCLEHRDLREVHDPECGPVLRCDNPRCGPHTIPHLYGEDYAAHPPVPLSVVGPPGHGSSYIEGLIHEIDAAGRRWADAGFSCTWLDEGRTRRRARDRPEAQPRADFRPPKVLRLHGVPRVGGSQIVIADPEAVRHSPAVVWLLRMTRGGPDDADRTLTQLGDRTREQDLVLTLTEGDELLHRPDLPESARLALAEPDYCPGGAVWDALERASADLEGWLGSCGCRDLVTRVRSRFRSVRYCVVSARGTPRRGVLAPLLWLWRLDRDPVWVERAGARDLYLDFPAAVAAGTGTVHLEERVYRLAAPLGLLNPVTIVGRGPGKTVIEVSSPGYGIGVRTAGKVTLRALTVRRAADGPPGDLIRVLGGELELRDVTVSGGLSGELAGRPVGGAGVLAGKHARLTAAGCEFRSNHGNGVLVIERTTAELTGCTFEKNGDAGVYARTAGAVTVTRGASRENHTGVWIEAAAAAAITANDCERNAESGIVLSGHVGGSVVVRGNTCAGNGRDGVHVRTAAAPTVVGNTCTVNRRNGVAFTDQSAGTARGNACTLNGRHGLRACDDAAPTLEGNTAEGNA
ncbi:MAG TPA: right-handed parallel beta-helix repeat-containing protein, partial [Fimbriiglobus sp.]|nr:right-handed parallel beta-helix repeat-containing protein [Fimbriiglobus sp.]